MLPQSSYGSVPSHLLLGRAEDRIDEWDLESSIPSSIPLHPALASMPSAMSTAHWTDSDHQSSASLHARIHQPERSHASHQQSLNSADNMAGEPRAEASFNGPIRCWSDRCNGREFSSIGNYRRHFREQHRVSKKFCCQRCGRPFSRSTARNLHYEKKKCRSIQFDENGIPVSLPFPDAADPESYSPTASLETSSPDESRHPSFDDSFSPYLSSAQSMTYTEPATHPAYAQRISRDQDQLAAFHGGGQLHGWDDHPQVWDDAMSWNYLDQAMTAAASTATIRAPDLRPQATSVPWSRSSVMGY